MVWYLNTGATIALPFPQALQIRVRRQQAASWEHRKRTATNTTRNKQEVLGTTNRLFSFFLRYDTGRIENDAFNNFSVGACVFVAAVTFLPSRCLATIRGYTYRRTDSSEGFMKYAIEMSSGAMIYIPSFIKIDSSIQKLMGWDLQTRRQHDDLIGIFLFFKNKKNRLNYVSKDLGQSHLRHWLVT
jgi:hypothetical protein